ncbi:unnamed protein product [Bursaphelenchus xylophilus]|nr:unnamed protein product [Bursaphelenchus xylophilus]CAG9094998.1 unnamed protein product [Bursaphelenchus xylophilus]
MGEIVTNMGSCFATGPKVTLLNLSPSAITDQEITDKAKAEFARAATPAERLRFGCIATGIAHLKSFSRYIRQHPNLTLAQLHELVTKLAVSFTDDDLDQLIPLYVTNGRINTQKLLSDVKIPLAEHRQKLLRDVFEKIAGEKGATEVDVAKFVRNFSFKQDRDYVSGKKSDSQIREEFKKKFNLAEHEDGKVTLDDFIDYYGSISYGCHSDAYFDLFLRQAWNY